jgi:hypothetical protein
MRTKQLSLFETKEKKRYTRTQHGGTSNRGKRKLERPLSTKQWIHLVLKSDKAIGKMSFLNPVHKLMIEQTLRSKSKKFGVPIADKANAGNHLHLKIRITSRESFQQFLKSSTSLIARKITGARRGKPFGRFWQGLAYTRVLKSWTEELNLRGYIMANRLEAKTSPEARARLLKRFNAWVYRERRRELGSNLSPNTC